MSAAVITTEHAAQLDPAQVAPPIITNNRIGHDSLFEHTEGGTPQRILPLIGNSHPTRWAPRPYVLDVMFDGGRRRVYADDTADAAGVILGEAYRALQVAAAAAAAAFDDDPNEDTAQAVVDTDAALFAARAAHATTIRTALQRQHNEAITDWAALDQWDTQVLHQSMDPDALAPGCYPDNHPLNGALSTITGAAEAGEKLLWAADAVLVCSTGDYWPYSDVLPPQSVAATTVTGVATPVTLAGDSQLVWLKPDNEAGYLESLRAAGVITIDIYPVDQVDTIWQTVYERIHSKHANVSA